MGGLGEVVMDGWSEIARIFVCIVWLVRYGMHWWRDSIWMISKLTFTWTRKCCKIMGKDWENGINSGLIMEAGEKGPEQGEDGKESRKSGKRENYHPSRRRGAKEPG